MNNDIYVLLDKIRSSIISMNLPYSLTAELFNQILEIEKAVDNCCSNCGGKMKGGAK